MMNCSSSTRKPKLKCLHCTIAIGLMLGLLIGLITGLAVGYGIWNHKTEAIISDTPKVQEAENRSFEITIPEPSPSPEPSPEPLGEFRITAYCACKKCCGQWAANRPDGVVYGAAGVELTPGLSAASPLPFGTVVEIDGLGEYVVQDRTAQWVVDKYGKNLIDLYFTDHEAACDFGLQYRNVYLKEEPNHDQV